MSGLYRRDDDQPAAWRLAGDAGSGSRFGFPALDEQELARSTRRYWRCMIWLQCKLFLLTLLLWPVPVINPVKLLVVLIHELSHVAAAYATGGVVLGIAIDPGGAGVTLGLDGNRLVILAMGYTGSVLVGMALFAMVNVWDAGQVWGVLSLLACLTLAFGWVNEFTMFFGYGTLALLLIGAFKLSYEGKRLILRWVATTCCLYPVIDVASEVWSGQTTGITINGHVALSDIAQLAQLKGLSESVLAGTWIVAGLIILAWMFHWSARRDARALAMESMTPPPRDYDQYLRGGDNPRTYVIR